MFTLVYDFNSESLKKNTQRGGKEKEDTETQKKTEGGKRERTRRRRKGERKREERESDRVTNTESQSYKVHKSLKKKNHNCRLSNKRKRTQNILTRYNIRDASLTKQ